MRHDYIVIESNCLEHLKVDYLPLNDIVREFTGFEKSFPSNDEFKDVLDFLIYIIPKYNLGCLEGKEMAPVDKSLEDIIEFLKRKWEQGKYEEISYGIWFCMKSS